MQAPTPYELVEAANKVDSRIEFKLKSSRPVLGYCYFINFVVDDLFTMTGDLRMDDVGVRFDPAHVCAEGNIDGRKNKTFKFEEFGDVFALAEALVAYMRNALKNYQKPSTIVKEILKEIDKEVVKAILSDATLLAAD